MTKKITAPSAATVLLCAALPALGEQSLPVGKGQQARRRHRAGAVKGDASLTGFMRGAAIVVVSLLAACGGGTDSLSPADGAPPAPDYANPSSWLALPPGSVLGVVPPNSGLSDLQSSAKADVFYLLPTTSTGDSTVAPNANYDDPIAYAFAVQVAMNQATAFNASGRIFAPLYRGIKNEGWGAALSSVQAPLDLAYSDAKRAFDYYLANYNGGRPIIFVSHSQGDIYLYRILLEEFDGKPLARQLVAAYIVGQPLAANFFADYHTLGPCNTPIDVGCMIGWCTFGSGTTDPQVASWAYEQYYWLPSQQMWGPPLPPFASSDNPMSWVRDGAVAPQNANLGSLPANLQYPAPPNVQLMPLIPGVVSAQGTAGATYVQPAPIPANAFSIAVNGTPLTAATPPFVYHYFDFNLFWMNIRLNVRDRLNAYLANSGAAYPLITSPIVATGAVGLPFSFTVTTQNQVTNVSATGLAAGLSISPGGTISGMPTAVGTSAVVITVSNSAGSSTGELAITVR